MGTHRIVITEENSNDVGSKKNEEEKEQKWNKQLIFGRKNEMSMKARQRKGKLKQNNS